MATTHFSGPVSSASGFLDAGTGKTDFQQFIGIQGIINISAGTWTATRIARGNYVKRHTAAAETSIIGVDLAPAIRTAASKGFKLASVDVIYSIGTAALVAHSATLDLINYANNTAVAITATALTGSLATAAQASPYVSNLAVTTPAFDNTADSKYLFELTVNAALTSAYDYYGLVLQYTRNDN